MLIGVLIGTAMPENIIVEGEIPQSEFGPASSPLHYMDLGDNTFVFLNRHGTPSRIPPHKVNHRANLLSMRETGAKKLISICSCGSLKREITIPSFAVPEDYIDFHSGTTLVEGEILHVTPGLDDSLREALNGSLDRLGLDYTNGGTYVQMKGPRLETKAEISVISGWGEYVGMSLGSEATLAVELGIPFAGLLSVDNYANGIGGVLDFREIIKESRSKWDIVVRILENMTIL